MQKEKLKSIVMIGPVYPYKGGISHYTTSMYRTLKKSYDTNMISYKLQYPKFMFRKEQRNFENTDLQIPETEYSINTISPISWLSTVKRIKEINPDLIIFQWWHPYFSPCYWAMCKMLHGFKLMFLCHNVFPHERFPLDRFLCKHVLRQGDYFVTQSEMDKKDLLSIKENARVKRTVLPTFNEFKFKNLTCEVARKLLDISIDTPVLLFFGFVRPYKGLHYLLKAIPAIKKEISNIKLMVVGEFGADKEEYLQLITELDIEKEVDIYGDYIPDREIEKYFAASDLVVLPYKSATQSGIVQIAYSFEKPVVVTSVGGLPEVVEDEKTGYIVPPCQEKEIVETVIKFFGSSNREQFKEAIKKEAYKYSWDRMTEAVEGLWYENNVS